MALHPQVTEIGLSGLIKGGGHGAETMGPRGVNMEGVRRAGVK